ncbi:hypothetical protein G7Y89_g14177 [Cudoniella acicularis]|uniref:Alpha/beta hydrolase fold-3 domain-containing protein n=1 Tax=Cudoniella acicularis TaxID=354080 RepID=A0A8H4VVD4_9HELO|nr:hypothetical protein G7Y89_g14177 [Cudoniella acicularis]
MPSQIPEDWASLSTPNPEMLSLLEKSYPPGFRVIKPGITIQQLREIGKNNPSSEKWLDVEERDIEVVMSDGYLSRARVYTSKSTPTSDFSLAISGSVVLKVEEGGVEKREEEEEEGENGKEPLLVMIHGGGFSVGKPEMEEERCRFWVREFKGVSVSLGYRLAPENAWPRGVEDCWEGVKWIAQHAKELGADARKGFVLGGISSGATTSIGIAHRARDEGMTPPLTGLYLSVPGICTPESLPEEHKNDPRLVSWEQNRTAPLFSTPELEFFASQYQSPPNDPLRSPLIWPTGHKGLPRHYLQVAGLDPRGGDEG